MSYAYIQTMNGWIFSLEDKDIFSFSKKSLEEIQVVVNVIRLSLFQSMEDNGFILTFLWSFNQERNQKVCNGKTTIESLLHNVIK